ncbi:FAD/NAD(P)-binding domain-containing protein [Annulohypoxylon maeteangense]|uniref:FAD/NAD(P)-binding domain-containing protein n=1 Tax=Annulohypoxylon maeteangense TaxID=1927788 RepID=UPI002007F942|nr:FAD/NAD(P)-binding domain-containing protein [Annulohypoxylon maeteangense]KAI0888802.1 FAD/NAD(P)-binding domain-containing protein [Annulohypoxylon maeteangense]
MPHPPITDVLILGSGPAGLSCASALARQLHSAIVFSTSVYRNARATHMHNVLGYDHVSPSIFRGKARADIEARYAGTIQFRDVGVVRVRRVDDGVKGKEDGRTRFEVLDEFGKTYVGRKLVLAMGVRDVMPAAPEGYAELWGYGIFHCLFCHGFEERGSASAGVLAIGPMLGGGGNDTAPLMAPVIARMAARLAGHVTVYTDGNETLGSRIREQLKSNQKFHVENRRLVRLAKDPDVGGNAGVLVTLEDGNVNKEGFLAHVPAIELNGSFAADLGVALAPQGHIDAQPPFYTMNVPGVYAAGDCATMMKAVPMATMMGSSVAAGLAHVLQAEDDVEE